jgi:phage terminase small subunit
MQFPIEQFTAKQQLFILHYVRSQHITNAAIEAGVKPSNASAQGSKWFANPKIRQEIDKRIALKTERYYVAPERIIREMALMAFSNLEDFVKFSQDNQAMVGFENVTRDQMASLTEIVTDEFRAKDGSVAGVRTKIKMADKQSALMNLAKLINMLQPDKVEHTGTIAHEHKHAHVVLNPRDLSPRQRLELRRVLTSIERGPEDDAKQELDAEDSDASDLPAR